MKVNFIDQQKDFYRPWVKFYGKDTPPNLEYSDKTMFGVFYDTATQYSDYNAIDYMEKKITYGELLEEVKRCAVSLAKLGIKKGDRITLCLPNIPQAVISFYATLALGAVANMIHPLSASNEIEYFINVSKSKMLFILDAFYEKTKDLNCETLQKVVTASAADYLSAVKKVGFALTQGRKIPKVGASEKTMTWVGLMKLSEGVETPKIDEHPDNKYSDTAVILYSGGTTGTQKGIMLSHLNFNALAAQTVAHGGPSFKPGDSMLAVLPMFHGFGLGVCIHTSVYKGATMILVPRFNADSFAELIVKKKPTFMAGVPTLYEALLRKDRLAKADFSETKGIFSGGDKLPHDLKVRFDEFLKEKNAKVTLREGYGLTECVTASALNPEGAAYRKGSIGIPYPDTLYKIVELGTTNDVPYGTDGEICIHGPSVMQGYLDDPEETATVLKKHPDGRIWLHTGDLGYIDEDGFVYFKLRIKRMIKTSGYSVYPTQIEEILNAHEAVSMSCVIGVPDDLKIQTIKAFIVLKEGYAPSEEMEKEIMRYCEENIAKYQIPRIIEFRDDLPTTKVGKIAYRVLEEEHLNLAASS